MTQKVKYFVIGLFYAIILLALNIYSFSQIDLNLTLSSNNFYQSIQSQLIYLGYFNRQLSSAIFLILLLLLYVFYIYCLREAEKKSLSKVMVMKMIIISVVISLFAYPAFSHDVFNYMFDARIVTKYQLNPYFYKALDFSGDLWVRFMHWTHRTYPYGPVWIIATLPFSYIGFGKFTLTLFSFKLMFVLFYLGNIYLLHKILKNNSEKNHLVGIIFYALNPLIIIESLVSPHNETMMLFFLLLFIYFFYYKKRFTLGIVNLLLSIGVKFATAVFLPFVIFGKFYKIKKKFVDYYLLILMAFAIIFEIFYREAYPWYFILLVGLGAININRTAAATLIIVLSFCALLRYIPYLYLGEYTLFAKTIQNLIMVIPVVSSLIIITVWKFRKGQVL